MTPFADFDSLFGESYELPLVSGSDAIRWAIHKTGQKYNQSRKETGRSVVVLAVFDVHRILRGQKTYLFYVPDPIDNLDPCRTSFTEKVRYGACNAEEYVAYAYMPTEALECWVTWEDLAHPSCDISVRVD